MDEQLNVVPLIKLARFENREFNRGASIWLEGLWWFVRSLAFASWIPVPSPIKVMLLRAFGAKIGRGVVIRSRVNISFPWRLEIGDYVWIGDEVSILTLAKIEIGSNVCISQRAFLCTGSHNFSVEGFDLVTKPIDVSDSVWIAAGCFVGPGVAIGKGSLCAAGSVIVRDVPERVVMGGNPARVLKRLRFEDFSCNPTK